MKNLRPLISAAVLFAALLSLTLLAGCPQGTTISRLNGQSSRYLNHEVAIQGNVVSSIGLLGQGAFQVDDGTGTIWVLSNGYGVPGKGSRVGVAGRFASGLTFGSRTFASAIQQTHRPRFR